MARWDPWCGCHRYSEGCKFCYIHKGDAKQGMYTHMHAPRTAAAEWVLILLAGRSQTFIEHKRGCRTCSLFYMGNQSSALAIASWKSLVSVKISCL